MKTRTLVLFGALFPAFGCPGDDTTAAGDDSSNSSSSGGSDDAATPEPITDVAQSSTGEDSLDDTGTAAAEEGCGNGIVEDEEECDDGAESAECNADCTAAACGDGVVNNTAGEACDDGGETNSCNDDCSAASCGDGVLNATAGEVCDDEGPSETCDDDCTGVACGDGNINLAASELCDDGNEVDFDFCNSMCMPAPPVLLEAFHVLDTDTGELDGTPLVHWDPATATWYSTGFELAPGAVLVAQGSLPLTLEVRGIVDIFGLIDVSGEDGIGAYTAMGENCDTAGLGGEGGAGGFPGGNGAGFGGTGTEDGQPGGGPGMNPAGGGVASTVTGTACPASGSCVASRVAAGSPAGAGRPAARRR